MIAWINITVLLLSTALTYYFYVKSVSPAALEQKIGAVAYQTCGRYRIIAGVWMTVSIVNYILYLYYPLPLPLPLRFPWGWPISATIGLVIALPSGYLFYRGMKDAGEETMRPKKEHSLYSGIYEKIRHPQAAGESVTWLVIALLLNSPFLTLYSFVWFPIYYGMCVAEEKDLIIRYGQAYIEYRDKTGFVWPK